MVHCWVLVHCGPLNALRPAAVGSAPSEFSRQKLQTLIPEKRHEEEKHAANLQTLISDKGLSDEEKHGDKLKTLIPQRERRGGRETWRKAENPNSSVRKARRRRNMEKESEERRRRGESESLMTKDNLDSVSAATATVAQQLHNLLSPSDVDTLKHQQLLILGRLQDSNAVLSHFNEFSERSFVAVANNFSHNTRLLKSMKNDLDYVFHKISSLKTRIQKQYPNAFKDTVAALDTDNRPDLNAPQ